ncbi:MAG: ChaN family lipoprotein [Thermodesulfovibrionales bacterium]
MKAAKKAALWSLALVLGVLALASVSVGHLAALRVSDGREIGFPALVEEIRGADVVLVGELHDNPGHHEVQLAVIKALREGGARVAVGLEMFASRSQPALDSWVRGGMDPRRFISVYYDNWRMPWPLYAGILTYLREEGIPAVGLNVPQRITQKVAEMGFDSLTPEELRDLPPGLSCDVSESYRDYIREMYSMHDTRDRSFEHFCEAQLLWDKAMAWRLLKYLRENPGTTVVVLAGLTHAMKRGIPWQMDRMSEGLRYKVLMPATPGMPPGKVTSERADYVVFF